MQSNAWWLGLLGHVSKYVAACETCQHTKAQHGPIAAPPQPSAVPSEPWENVTGNLISPLPES